MYETTELMHVKQKMIGGSDRHMLKVRKVLDHIKDKYYEMAGRTADWTVEERNPIIERWIGWLDKLTGLIRRRGVKQALKELKDEAEREQKQFKKRKRIDEDSEVDSIE